MSATTHAHPPGPIYRARLSKWAHMTLRPGACRIALTPTSNTLSSSYGGQSTKPDLSIPKFVGSIRFHSSPVDGDELRCLGNLEFHS